MAKLDNIHAKLIEASKLLDQAAQEMREGTGMPLEQISKIGAAMAEVMMVRHQIYVLRPDLMPGYLQDPDKYHPDGQDKTGGKGE
jgi:hypothetical protein